MGGGGSTQVTETETQKEQVSINESLWDYYQSEYKPLISQYIDRATSQDVKTEQELNLEGQTNAEVMKNLSASNVSSNPAQNTATVSNIGRVMAGAQTRTQGSARSRELSETQNIIDIGRGQATESLSGMSDMASQSVSAEIADLELAQQRNAASENAIGSVAGSLSAGFLRSLNK